MFGAIVWLVAANDESTEAELPPGLRPVPAEAQEQIDALVDDWIEVWNEQDGEGLRDLVADDFRYVGTYAPTTGLDGWDIDRLIPFIDTSCCPSSTATDRVIVERIGLYFVAQKYTREEGSTGEFLELYTIVDDEGTLEFQYIESWAPLGWHQLDGDQPYTPIQTQSIGWPEDPWDD